MASLLHVMRSNDDNLYVILRFSLRSNKFHVLLDKIISQNFIAHFFYNQCKHLRKK